MKRGVCMYFVKKNIIDFFKNHKDMFFIFFILQIISVFFIFFIYGLLVNYQKELDNMTYDTLNFEANFNGGGEFLPLREAMTEILDSMGDKVSGVCVLGSYSDGDINYYINAHDDYSDDGKFVSPTFCNPFKIVEGRGLEDGDFQGNDYVAIASGNLKVGDNVELGGNKYNVVGEYLFPFEDEKNYLEIPYRLLPEKNYYVICIALYFEKNPTESDYNIFKEALTKKYGESVYFKDLYLDKSARIKTLKSMNLVAFIIGVLSSINIVVIYMNLIEKRRRKNAVIQICGYPYGKMCRSLFAEIVLLDVVSLLVGSLVFFGIYKLTLVNIFTYFDEVFTISSVVKLSAIYLCVTTVVAALLSVFMNKREPLQLLRRTYYV